jgi:hypothetical protein
MMMIVEIGPHPSHRVALLGKDSTSGSGDVEFPVKVVDSGNIPTRPTAVKPADFVGGNFPFQYKVIHICVEAYVPLAFPGWSARVFLTDGMGRNVVFDLIWSAAHNQGKTQTDSEN